MSVTEINGYINRTLKYDPILNNALIVGEISNYKRHSSGHLYFTLKDQGAKISCVMFRGDASELDYEPVDGEKTELRGSIAVYEKEGKYQVYVTQMSQVGKGELFKAFIKLKDELQLNGYFDKKQPIKSFPNRIGIVTSQTSAALRDMLKVLKRRNSNVEVVLYPTKVQGEFASHEISKGIEYFNESNSVDTIIIGRGGGSIEELWAFNEMVVAESIFYSKIPIISGVGHETDFTISDFVADVRAATPTEAAEIAVRPLGDYREGLYSLRRRLINVIGQRQKIAVMSLEKYSKQQLCQLVKDTLTIKKTNIDSSYNILHNKIGDCIDDCHKKLNIAGVQLDTLSPLKTLTRGYAIVEKDHVTITDINEIETSDRIDIILKNGIIRTEVISKEGKLLYEKK